MQSRIPPFCSSNRFQQKKGCWLIAWTKKERLSLATVCENQCKKLILNWIPNNGHLARWISYQKQTENSYEIFWIIFKPCVLSYFFQAYCLVISKRLYDPLWLPHDCLCSPNGFHFLTFIIEWAVSSRHEIIAFVTTWKCDPEPIWKSNFRH